MASTSHQSEIEIVNAFHGLAPPLPPASASPLQNSTYDVFINHRGPDVKEELANDIHKALYSMGLKVFLDSQNLELGDFFPTELQHAMSTSSLHIAIFSPTYAKSPWCLAELSFILNTGAPIIPIFYQVEPAHLRHLKGIYKASFTEYEEKGRYTDRLKEWKTALHNASFYEGEIINNNNNNNGEEQKHRVLKNIVNRVLKIMKRVPLEVATHPVGLEDAVADFEKTISESEKNNSDVQIVGIWGMGGSGKTTLAKELYNKKSLSVGKSSFVFDVRDAASKGEMHIKQRLLLKDLGFVFDDQPFGNIEQGKTILSNYLRSLSVFVVLDDVDHRDQLEALLPGKGSLASGSLIIITTRDKEVLNAWGVSCIYEIKSMNQSHAKQLFCWHAFLQSSPLLGFEDLVEEFVSVSNGLPLFLKVLGGQLHGCFNKILWADLLLKISRILPDDIINRLKVSYDALDEEEQQMFLDVACFFIGQDKMIAIAVWEGSGWSGQWGWERLVNKCLVELLDDNKIRMHDHLRDLGRKIASTLPPHRLWSPDQLRVINKQEQIRGMILDAATNDIQKLLDSLFNISTSLCCWRTARRPFPCGLKIFLVGRNFVNNLLIAELSEGLAWLNCTGIAHKNLPSWMTLTNLRVLELSKCYNIVGLWKDAVEAPVQLRVLIVSHCIKFKRIPKTIGYLKKLKKICLFGCNVKNLPEEFCHLQSLEHLKLSCNLQSLPCCFGYLRNLQHLDFSGCSQLMMLPDSFKQLTLLQHLNLQGCEKLTLQADIMENMTRLQYLNLKDCWQLEKLPDHITNQASLRELYLQRTKLRELPINIGQLSKLRVMEISPMGGCFQMQSLPDSMGSLTLLQQLTLKSLKVQTLPISFEQLISLEVLNIINCPMGELDFGSNLQKITLISLRVLHIIDCPMGELDFGSTFLGSNLKEIKLSRTRLSKITITDGCCPYLKILNLDSNDHLTDVDTLPRAVEDIYVRNCRLLRNISGIGGERKLQSLKLQDCPELEMLPSLAKLALLRVFELTGGNKIRTIQGLQHCTSLKTLVIDGAKCWDVSDIEGLEQLQRLKHVQLAAKNRSTLLPCIEMIQKRPEELMIWTKANANAGPLLKCSAFPNLSDVRFFANNKFKLLKRSLKCSAFPNLSDVRFFANNKFKRSLKCSAFPNLSDVIVCYVIKCNSPTLFIIKRPRFCSSFELGEGKWVWMGVFPQHYRLLDWHFSREKVEIEVGMIGRGEEESLVESFHRLLALLAP